MTAIPAELSTVQAATRFGGRAASVPDFDSLFDALEAAQMPLGIEGRLRCWVVLSRLSALGSRFDDASELTAHLTPVLAGSRREQTDVGRLIEEWIASGRPREPTTRKGPARDEVAPPVERVATADRTGRAVALSLAVLAVVAAVGIIAAQISSGKAINVPAAAGNLVSYSQPVLRLNLGLNPVWQDVFENLLSRLGFAAIVLMLGSAYFAWSGEVKGRLIRRLGHADLLRAVSLTAEAPGWFRTVDARAAFDRLKRVRWSNTDQIDVAESVARSTRSGGLPIVVRKRLRELPTYVLLVDRAAHDDHASLFARELEAALNDARIVYTRYDFSGTLERLNPVRRGEKTTVVDREYLPFSVVATRHAGERLILAGAGTDFFEIAGARVDDSGARIVVRPGTPRPNLIHLREFSSASLFTPAPFSTWGQHERRLSEIGFTVYSADVRGVENLAAQLIHEVDAPSSNLISEETSDIAEFLLWLDHNEMRLMSDVPLGRDEIRDLVHNLRIWSQRPEVFTLVGAIAAFPKIAPGFTFVLGGLILPPKKDAAGRATREPVFDSTLFGQLVRLPWIRSGHMPDWLRIGIVNALRPAQRTLVRQIQIFVLNQTEDPLDASRKPRSLDQLVARFEVAREKEYAPHQLREAADGIPPGEMRSADERIFFSTLRGEKLDPELDVIRPEAPEIIAHRMDEPERRRRTRLRYAVVGIAAIAALLQPWIFDLFSAAGDMAGAGLVFVARLVPFEGVGFLSWATRPLMLIALAQWLLNVMRTTPRVMLPLRSWLGPTLQVAEDPRFPAFLAVALSVVSHLASSSPDSAGSWAPHEQVTLIGALAITAWVWVVTPERWWQSPGIDGVVRPKPRSLFGASAGTFLVFAVWAIPIFLGVLPRLLGDRTVTRDAFLIPVVVAAIAWAASNALMRRWMLGVACTWLGRRIAVDAAFGAVCCLGRYLRRPKTQGRFG